MCKTNLGTVRRYVFTPEIFDCIKKTSLSMGNEIQIADAIRLLKGMQKIYAYKFHDRRYDTGDRVEYIQAIIDFALENKNIKKEVLNYLNKLV